ncbi:MAG: hypothetical protein IPJ19_09190 [Planctomycetes bacterium]|nr:hypothetical protein [Planctomycetota bacterium]
MLHFQPGRSSRTSLVALCGAFAFLAPSAAAQGTPTFSIDWRSRSKALPAGGVGPPLNECRILSATTGAPSVGPQPAPLSLVGAGALGLPLATNCTVQPPGVPCQLELDALSYGGDARFRTNLANQARLYFCVDPYAVGRSILPVSSFQPSVRSEAQVFDATGDVFFAAGVSGAVPPLGGIVPVVPPDNVGTIDGDGQSNPPSGTLFAYPGLGLIEPNIAILPPPSLDMPGDTIDALSLEPPPVNGSRIYFSLDGSFTDPLTQIQNSGSAQANGFLPGMVLVKVLGSGGLPAVYAQPTQLGLDLSGPGTDDLDALVLFDNGDGVFTPASALYGWNAAGGPDMLLFSVRRGSALIGQPDSLFGLPIEPSDILINPAAPGQRPRIFIAGENLGAATARSGQTTHGDDVTAIATEVAAFWDCNNNTVEDSVDIATGQSADDNNNGIPDECERPAGTRTCLCPTSANPPCGNADSGAGCANSTGLGASLDSVGSASISNDDLLLVATQLPPNAHGLWLMASGTAQVQLGDGLRCVGGTIARFGAYTTGSSGVASRGPIAGGSCSLPFGCIQPGSTWHFQAWYRNVTGPCGNGTNLSNLLSVSFTP